MPLTQLTINGQISWAQQLEFEDFQPRKQGRDSKSFNSTGVDLTYWNQILTAVFPVPPNSYVPIDLRDWINLLAEEVAFDRVLSMLVQVEGADVEVMPGASHPLLWFFR